MSTATPICYPAPIKPGARIAVTALSSGVQAALHPRLDLVLGHLRAQGYEVVEGLSLRHENLSASAPAGQRAAELMHVLQRDDIAAVIPPWGGELAIELLDKLDWSALQHTTPKWLLGYSDTSTLMLPITLRLGWATAHGPCLMDLAPGQNDTLTANALKTLTTPGGGVIEQKQSSHWQSKWTDFAEVPNTTYALTEPTQWCALQGQTEVQCSGRLMGGCIDTLMHLASSAFGDVRGFIDAHRATGTLLYFENAELSPTALVRALHQLRWAGWLDGINGLLIGRSAAPDSTGANDLRYSQALQSTLGDLPCPVLVDVDIGHRPPQMVLINGAVAQVRWSAAEGGRITQRLL